MKQDFWKVISDDGKIVKYGYKELSDGIAGISAKVNGRFLMILQRSIRAPLTRKQVEAVFAQFLRVDHRRASTPQRLTM
jgi:hypothetical protein